MRKLSQKSVYILPAVALVLWLSAMTQANAQTRYQTVHTITPATEILTVSYYELALIQVLSEICPSMLNNAQKTRFARAYDNQLRQFMPNSPNPQQTLRAIATQRDYRIILQNVRVWTKSYPAAENLALCREFAGTS